MSCRRGRRRRHPVRLLVLGSPGMVSIQPAILLALIAGLTLAAGGGVVCRYGELGADLQVVDIIN